MTTGMERLEAAITGAPCDRIPVFCNLSDQGARELGMSIEEYYSDGEHVAEGQLRMRARYGYDNLWAFFYVGREAEILGCRRILFAKDGPPTVGEFILENETAIHALRIPDDVASHPKFEPLRRCIDTLRREAGGLYPICAYVTATMSLPAILMGMERWLELLLLGPAALRDELLEKCREFLRREVEAYREAGADLILYTNPFGSTDLVPMRMFRELVLPSIRLDMEAVGRHRLIYYGGLSRLNAVIDQVIEATGIGAYYLSPKDDVTVATRVLAGRGLCIGGIDDIQLIHWSAAQIRDEVRRVIEAGIAGGKFAFGAGAMPLQVPEENLRLTLETAYEAGSLARSTR